MKKKTKLTPYLYVIPGLLMVLGFVYIPIIVNLVYSFFRLSSYSSSMKFVGLDNFRRLFTNDTFPIMIRNNVYYCVISLIVQVGFGTFLAFLLESRLASDRFKSICRNIYFLPALTSVVVAGTIFRLMFGEMETSLANQVIGMFGLGPIKWLKNDLTGYFALLLLACWRWTGVNILYFLAGLQSISTDLYEAASIDGANKWQQFTKISLPLLKPTTVYVLTISIYAGLAMFNESYMLWKGNNSPQNIGLTIVGYLYRQGIEKRAMGYACAVGLVLLIIVMIVNMIQLAATGTFKKEER